MFDPWTYAEKYSTEHGLQTSLFQWANMAANFGLTAANDKEAYTIKGNALANLDQYDDRIPELKYMHAIHNQGHGDVVRGLRAKAEGLKKGVPDIFLPIRIDCQSHIFKETLALDVFADVEVWLYSGLYIELKKPKVGKVSTTQEDWQAFLRKQGFVCEICYGWIEAKDLIFKYLKEGGLI